MILVDTNVIIDFWDKPTEEIKKIFDNQGHGLSVAFLFWEVVLLDWYVLLV